MHLQDTPMVASVRTAAPLAPASTAASAVGNPGRAFGSATLAHIQIDSFAGEDTCTAAATSMHWPVAPTVAAAVAAGMVAVTTQLLAASTAASAAQQFVVVPMAVFASLEALIPNHAFAFASVLLYAQFFGCMPHNSCSYHSGEAYNDNLGTFWHDFSFPLLPNYSSGPFLQGKGLSTGDPTHVTLRDLFWLQWPHQAQTGDISDEIK